MEPVTEVKAEVTEVAKPVETKETVKEEASEVATGEAKVAEVPTVTQETQEVKEKEEEAAQVAPSVDDAKAAEANKECVKEETPVVASEVTPVATKAETPVEAQKEPEPKAETPKQDEAEKEVAKPEESKPESKSPEAEAAKPETQIQAPEATSNAPKIEDPEVKIPEVEPTENEPKEDDKKVEAAQVVPETVAPVVEKVQTTEADSVGDVSLKVETAAFADNDADKSEAAVTTEGEALKGEEAGNKDESGDAEEEPPTDGEADDGVVPENLDFDEDKGNPQYIPKKGAFYEHDDRRGTDDEQEDEPEEAKVDEAESKTGSSKDSPEHRRAQKILQSETKDRWEHDLFDSGEQGPKTQGELVTQYGYDIRDESSAPRAAGRREYGRGPNKYTRDWKDERAYQGRTHNAQQDSRRNGKEFHPRKDDFPCLPDQPPEQQTPPKAEQEEPAQKPQAPKEREQRETNQDRDDRENGRRNDNNRKMDQPRKADNRRDQRNKFDNNRNDYGRDNRRPSNGREWDQRDQRDGQRDHRDGRETREYNRDSHRDNGRVNENWRSNRDGPRDQRDNRDQRDGRDQRDNRDRDPGMRQDNNRKYGSGRTIPEQRNRRHDGPETPDRRNYDEKKHPQQNQQNPVESKRYTAQRAALRSEQAPDNRNQGRPDMNAQKRQPQPQAHAPASGPVQHVPQQQFYDMQAPYYVQQYDGGVPPPTGPPQNFMPQNPYINQPPPFLSTQAAAQYMIGAPEGPPVPEVFQGGANGNPGITYFHPQQQPMYPPPPNHTPHQRPKAIIPIVPPPDANGDAPHQIEA